MKFEVGVVEASPLVFAWRQVKGIFRTWRHSRKYGLPANKWYGVYEAGTETVAAQCGCSASALLRAELACAALNEWHARQGQRHA